MKISKIKYSAPPELAIYNSKYRHIFQYNSEDLFLTSGLSYDKMPIIMIE